MRNDYDFKWGPSAVLRLPPMLGGDLVKVKEHFYNVKGEPMYRMQKGTGHRFCVKADYAEKTYKDEPTRVN